MPFLLRNNVFTLPPEKELAQYLFDSIQELPSAEENEEDSERQNSLAEEHTYGVMEKGYIKVKAMPQSNYYLAGTDNLHSCIGLSFYDPASQTLIVTHMDVAVNAQSLDPILDEFKGAEEIQVRVFGGLTDCSYLEKVETQDNPFPSSTHHIDSLQKAKEIYTYLYQKSLDQNITINMLSSNAFAKLENYKTHCFQNRMDTTFGFVVNAANGKVQVFYHEGLDQWLPSTTVSNCGLFKGPYKKGGIGTRMHKYWGFESYDLVKRYDNTDPHWNEDYKADLEKRSLLGIANVLFLILINKFNYIKINKNDSDEICKHILEWIKQNSPLHNEPGFYTIHLLEYEAEEVAKRASPSYQGKSNLFIYNLINEINNNKFFNDMIYQHVINEIVSITLPNNNNLADKLREINCDLLLVQELDAYKLKFENNKENLLFRLKNEENTSIEEIIATWKLKKIDSKFNAIVKAIAMKLQYKGEDFSSRNQNKLKKHLMKKLSAIDIHNVDYVGLVADMMLAIENRIESRNGCFWVPPIINDKFLNRLNRLVIEPWILSNQPETMSIRPTH
ncbi:MAG: hypothetical protein EPO11_03735 [Gammaproteobacteria bacterium]|nr:MAG: hypothetical protein EPO11_03735 [Gammaproteobacteria bacterium]